MFSRSARLLAVLVAFAALLPSVGSASEIRMTNGTIYDGATIIRRDAANVECYWQHRTLILPAFEISRIDGVRMSEISEHAYPYVTSVTASSPRPVPTRAPSTPRPTPTATPTLPRTFFPTVTPTPPALVLSPVFRTPVPTAAPTARVTPPSEPASTLRPSTSTSAVHLPRGPFPWVPVAVSAFCFLWVASVVGVWRDGRRMPGKTARTWLIVAIALPVAGYIIYESVRFAKRWRAGQGVTFGHRREFIFLDADHRPMHIEPGEVATGIENAKDILQDALLDRASDVHIEPNAMECRVRFRIDGILHPRMKFPSEDGLRLVSALKTVAQLDIAERRKAQDGRFGGRVGEQEVDFRAATTPSVYGEKLVLRILDQKSGLRGLGDLGMSDAMRSRYAEIIHSRSGMILATGPTGSGKTSSLYAALTQLDSIRLNIVTIEDPVEYQLPGSTQIPVNVRAGVTYESGLRSILRQDPDVILVGEMRDLEAGQIALRSALTGHLVFTSLHTKDAIGTIHRLEEMGIERHLLASALFVVMSQRLVRVLCTACREPYPSTGKELLDIGLELPAGETIYKAVGCRKCESSGYVGRTGIFEMLILDDELRQEINAGMPEEPFAKLARKKGYRGYREDGAEKILLGVTSVDEVMQAI